MGVFRTKFVTENVEQCGATSSNIEQHGERERERERLKTLPYTLNFQNSHNAQQPQNTTFTARTENVEQRGETWRNVEKGREREGEAQNTTLHAKFSIRYLRLADSQCLKRRS